MRAVARQQRFAKSQVVFGSVNAAVAKGFGKGIGELAGESVRKALGEVALDRVVSFIAVVADQIHRSKLRVDHEKLLGETIFTDSRARRAERGGSVEEIRQRSNLAVGNIAVSGVVFSQGGRSG